MQADLVTWFDERGYGFCKSKGKANDMIVFVKSITGKPFVGALLEVGSVIPSEGRNRSEARNVRVIQRGAGQ